MSCPESSRCIFSCAILKFTNHPSLVQRVASMAGDGDFDERVQQSPQMNAKWLDLEQHCLGATGSLHLLRSVVACFEPEMKRARMQVAAEGGKGGKGGKGQAKGGEGGKGQAEGGKGGEGGKGQAEGGKGGKGGKGQAEGGKGQAEGGKGGKGQSEGGKGGKGQAEGVEEDVPPPQQLPLDVPFPIMMVRTSCIVLSFTHCA